MLSEQEDRQPCGQGLKEKGKGHFRSASHTGKCLGVPSEMHVLVPLTCWGLKSCICRKLPGGADAAGLWTTL